MLLFKREDELSCKSYSANLYERILLDKVEEAVKEIKSMRVRGAGEIARYALSVLKSLVLSSSASSVDALFDELDQAAKKLLGSRPTAVSLPNSIRYIMHHAAVFRDKRTDLDSFKTAVAEKADMFIMNSKNAVKKIGEIGSKRIVNGDVLMTHCNSTAVLEVLRQADKAGKKFEVYVTETRPRFQGRLTAECLVREGIPCTLIVDSAMRYFMNKVDKVLVGADAIAVNGAVVNKVGTSLMALAAHEANTTFMVVAESYKFSPETVTGDLIWIEEREAVEVLPQRRRIPYLKVRNPSFDVTPPEYIDAIVTERGVIPPQASFWILYEMWGGFTPEELSSYQTLHPEADD